MFTNKITKEPSFILASVLSSMAAMLLPAGMLIYTLLVDIPNDASARIGVSTSIALLPFFYVLLVVYLHVICHELWKKEKLSLTNIVLAGLIPSIVLASLFSFPGDLPLESKVNFFIEITIMLMLCVSIGSLVWWLIAHTANKKT